MLATKAPLRYSGGAMAERLGLDLEGQPLEHWDTFTNVLKSGALTAFASSMTCRRRPGMHFVTAHGPLLKHMRGRICRELGICRIKWNRKLTMSDYSSYTPKL